MSNEFNDSIMESLAEEIQSNNPKMSEKDLQIKLLQAFESLPEPDFDEEEKDDE